MKRCLIGIGITAGEAAKLIDGLMTQVAANAESVGVTKTSGKPAAAKPKSPPGMISAAQRGYIEGLAIELGWVLADMTVDVHRLQNFIKERFNVDFIQWLDQKTASNVIQGLKSMKTRKAREKKGADVCGKKD